MKIAIQGTTGSFHDQAAHTFFNADIEIVPCHTFREVFELLQNQQVDRAIVAIENSLHGSINETYDFLMKYQPWIVGELYIHITFGLMSVPGATLDNIKTVYTQRPAFGQVKDYLHDTMPWVHQEEMEDTALSAKHVAKENDTTKAAIASYRAAELYQLDVIDDNIEDDPDSYTRFVVLSAHETQVIGANKTSIIMKTDHTPGALYKSLGVFAENDINLSKLESRPIPGKTWNYIFYIDFDNALTDEPARAALDELTKQGSNITILGTYKAGKMPQ